MCRLINNPLHIPPTASAVIVALCSGAATPPALAQRSVSSLGRVQGALALLEGWGLAEEVEASWALTRPLTALVLARLSRHPSTVRQLARWTGERSVDVAREVGALRRDGVVRLLPGHERLWALTPTRAPRGSRRLRARTLAQPLGDGTDATTTLTRCLRHGEWGWASLDDPARAWTPSPDAAARRIVRLIDEGRIHHPRPSTPRSKADVSALVA